jgi:hypothetical protein
MVAPAGLTEAVRTLLVPSQHHPNAVLCEKGRVVSRGIAHRARIAALLDLDRSCAAAASHARLSFGCLYVPHVPQLVAQAAASHRESACPPRGQKAKPGPGHARQAARRTGASAGASGPPSKAPATAA